MFIIIVIILIGLLLGYIGSKEPSKTQNIRLFDIFLYEPVQIYIGYVLYTKKLMPSIFGIFLIYSLDFSPNRSSTSNL